jgi:hypothetical protein
MPPGADTMSVYETIFPTQTVNGTLEKTASAIWHRAIGLERLVDSKAKRIAVSDGTAACEVLVATLDAQNRGVYRIFIFKQYGQIVVAGELRFDDIDRFKAIGEPAVASLENMSADPGTGAASVEGRDH